MDKWISESNPGKQMMLSIVCTIVGLAMAYVCRDFHGFAMTNTLAGFLLGVLLLLIGTAGAVTTGKQIIVIDSSVRSIVVEDRNIFGAKKRAIPFSDILHVGIGYTGKKSNYVTLYYLLLSLRSGEEYSLFAPGRFYMGGSDRDVVEGWRSRLEEYIGSQ